MVYDWVASSRSSKVCVFACFGVFFLVFFYVKLLVKNQPETVENQVVGAEVMMNPEKTMVQFMVPLE